MSFIYDKCYKNGTILGDHPTGFWYNLGRKLINYKRYAKVRILSNSAKFSAGRLFPAYNISATMASTHSAYRLAAVASLKFLAIENMPRITLQLRIVDYAMCGGQLSWQSYRIIATRLVTGSIARSANLPVFSLVRGRFWGFSPAGATRCTDGGEIWHGGGSVPPPCQISPPSVQRQGCRTPKIEIVTKIWPKSGI